MEHLTPPPSTIGTGLLGDGTAFAAVVARQMLTPTETAYVTVGDLDSGVNLIPCHLGAGPIAQADGSVVLPTKGDAALVLISSEGDHWIIAWTPAA